MILSQVMTIPKMFCDNERFAKLPIKIIFGNFYFLEIAITWLKIIQTWQVGGVLESSGTPLEDGHRDFEHRCILG